MNLFEHALLLSGHNGFYSTEIHDRLLLCRAASKIRKNGQKLLAGDRVLVEDHGDGTGFIREVEPRRNALVRPPVANIDLLVLVVAVTNPKPDFFQIDKLTLIAEHEQIPLAFALTKCDLGDASEFLSVYGKTPYPIFQLANQGELGSASLFDHLQGKMSVFCGASGVGKSTLLNRLAPHLHAQVGTLSEKIQRGKNTTRITTLHPLNANTYLADTPGFTMTDITRYCYMEKETLVSLFPEMRSLVGTCRYSHCTHLREEGCQILQAVSDGDIAISRQESYQKLYAELKNQRSYEAKPL